MQDLYTLERPSFYDDQANSKFPLRRWFHRSRHTTLRKLVEKYCDPDKYVLDVGCGNVLWNHDKTYSVIGIDINNDTLQYNIVRGRLIEGFKSSVTDLRDIDSETIPTVVCSEVLEHVPNFWKTIEEVHRVLLPGGHFITSVPYDTTLSLWSMMFPVWCFYLGNIKGDEYYKQKCGHVNHFSPRTIKQYLVASGFESIEQVNLSRFTIFTVVRKPC